MRLSSILRILAFLCACMFGWCLGQIIAGTGDDWEIAGAAVFPLSWVGLVVSALHLHERNK